jgi:hypothetical protein
MIVYHELPSLLSRGVVSVAEEEVAGGRQRGLRGITSGRVYSLKDNAEEREWRYTNIILSARTAHQYSLIRVTSRVTSRMTVQILYRHVVRHHILRKYISK